LAGAIGWNYQKLSAVGTRDCKGAARARPAEPVEENDTIANAPPHARSDAPIAAEAKYLAKYLAAHGWSAGASTR
jgi:hypothetical protein